jgi:hypothetical protein
MLIHVVMDREQLDRRDPQPGEVSERRRSGEPRIRAPKLRRDIWVPTGEALDMEFVDNRAVPRDAWGLISLPLEARVDHDTPRHERGRVSIIAREVFRRVPDPVAKDFVSPLQLPR